MADIRTIAKAKVTALALGKWLGIDPELDIQQDHVRLFWYPKDLKTVQNSFYNSMQEKDKKLRVDIMPVLMPALIKKYGIYGFGALVSAFLLGRN
jgi:hypothetical protein